VSRPTRLPSFNYLGFAQYFLTFCVINRRRVFTNARVVDLALTKIRQCASDERFSLLAYCFMPDHLHLLVEGKHEEADLRHFVSRAKQHSAAAHALTIGERLWQQGYYERVLRRSEDARTVARYILANPVRAGLVRDPREYPYLGSDVWTVDELMNSLE
jgi:putative transposase